MIRYLLFFLVILAGLAPRLALAQSLPDSTFGNVLGNASGVTVRPAGGATSCMLVERAFSPLNVLDYVLPGDVSDDLAFNRAIISRPVGSYVRLVVPYRVAPYVLAAPVTSNNRVVFAEVDPGAVIVGTLYVDRVTRSDNAGQGRLWTNIRGAVAQPGHPLADYWTIFNTGTNSAIARRMDYHSQAPGTGAAGGGGDVGLFTTAEFTALDGAVGAGGAGFGAVETAISPVDVIGTARHWSVVAREVNVTNRGPDRGWSARRSTLQSWTGAVQIVPDAGGAFGNVGTNVLFGTLYAKSDQPNTAGNFVKFHNGILAEPDVITPTGYFAYLAGGSTSALAPVAALAPVGNWQAGIDLSGGSFTVAPIKLPGGALVVAGPGSPQGALTAPVGSIYIRTDGAAAMTLYVKENGAGNTGWAGMLSTASAAAAYAPMSGNVGFYGTPPIAKPIITGARGVESAASASTRAALVTLGLATDNTTP